MEGLLGNLGIASRVPALVALLFVALGAYCVWLAVYRLYLSPLAKIPGPKLAALSFWYECYYDVILPGRYTWKLEELHNTYGKRDTPSLH